MFTHDFWIGLGVGLGIAFVILSIVQLPRIRHCRNDELLPQLVGAAWLLIGFGVGSWFIAFLCAGMPDVAAKIGWPPTIGIALCGFIVLRVVHRIVWGKDG